MTKKLTALILIGGDIDISLAEGTPLLALAAGAVVTKDEGGQMEGIYLPAEVEKKKSKGLRRRSARSKRNRSMLLREAK